MNSVDIINNVPNAKTSYSADGRKVTFTVTCNDGFVFDGDVTGFCIETGDLFEEETEITFVKSSDSLYVGNVTLTYDDATATIKGATKESTTPSKSITNKVNNTSYESSYSDGKYIITLTCDDGFVFSDDIICGWTDNTTGESGTAYMTLDEGKTTGAVEITTNEYSDIIINGETIPYVQPTTVTNNVDGADMTHSVVGTSVTGRLTAKDTRFVFIGCYARYSETTIEITPKTPTDNYVKFAFDVPLGSEVTINGECRGVCKTTDNTTGCTVSGLNPYYIEDNEINVTLNADTGTSFLASVPPTFSFNSPSIIDSDSGDFVVSEDRKTATLTYKLPNDADVVSLSSFIISGYTLPDKTVTGYGSVNVYKVTDTALESFADVRFKYVTGKDTSLTPDGDLGDYVVKLHKIFAPITDTTATTIKCGNNDTGISCDSINSPTLTIDCGECEIPKRYGSTTDYLGDINVFVPFAGMIKLDTDNVGRKLRLVYELDVVTGQGVFTIFSDDVPITKREVSIKRDILYLTSNTQQVTTIGSETLDSTYLMGLTPYVIHKYYDSIDIPFNTQTTYKRISECSGYTEIEVTDFTLHETVTKEEKDMIISQLRNGIII